ncbi:hypothetical protein PENTCL1PPCAC_2592, partial [Pristionchus entomophagus]
MFSRKKGRARVDFDPDFAGINTVRTFNVRNEDSWPAKVLCNVKDYVAEDHDEYDKQQHLFFDCTLPEPNDAQLFGPEEVLFSAGDMKVLQMTTTVPTLAFAALKLKEKEPCVKQEKPIAPTPNAKDVDVIELSDDEDADIMVVGEVKKADPSSASRTTLQQRQINKKADILSGFLKNKGIEETTVEIEKDNWQGDRIILDNHLDKYVEVSTQENRLKTRFILRLGDPKYVDNLVEPIPKTKKKKKRTVKIKKVKKEKKRTKKVKFDVPNKMRSPSPILFHFSSDDDAPLLPKKTQSNKKKVPPAAAPKRCSKSTKKTEDGASKVGLPASEFFVPRKDNKLRHANLSSLLKTKEAEQQKQSLLRKVTERKAREEELKRINEKNKKKADLKARIESEKLRMSRKEGVPPKIDLSEPMKKKVRLTQPEEPVDYVGTITEAMNAQKAVGKVADSVDESPRKGRDELVLPRMNDQPMIPPTVPPRFPVQGDDDMDISNSPDGSPRVEYSRDDPVSSIPSDEGIQMDRRTRLYGDHSPTIGGNNEVINDHMEDRMNHDVTDLANIMEGAHYNERSPGASYRFNRLDDIKVPVIHASLSISEIEDERLRGREIVMIPTDRMENDNGIESATDPRRLPLIFPSHNAHSNFKSTPIALNLAQDDYILPVTRKEEAEDKVKKKKKGVKWGENDTKEFNPDNDDETVIPIDIEKEKGKEKEKEKEKE